VKEERRATTENPGRRPAGTLNVAAGEYGQGGWRPRVEDTLACWDLRVESRAAATARELTRTALRRWRVTDSTAADDVILMVDELVTNAVVHGSGPVALRLSIDGSRVRGEVTDANPLLPEPGCPGPDVETGRGLLLVTALADEFGVMPGGYGKIVWFAQALAAGNKDGPTGPP
jgi:anti-sigma regulatory factor (Ser/Thr protein kinase)